LALIKMGALAQDVRGSLNGTVFSRNKGGAFVRSKVSPCQPLSRWSSGTREVFKACAQRWSGTLTAAQRSAWNAFALLHPYVNVFSDSIVLPGVAMYAAVNARLRQCGQTAIDEVPATFVVADCGGITVVMTALVGVLSLVVTPGRALVGSEGLVVWASLPLGGGRKLQLRDLRFMNLVSRCVFASGDPLGPQFPQRWPGQTWVVGQRVGIRVAILSKTTGAMSAPIGGEFPITAP